MINEATRESFRKQTNEHLFERRDELEQLDQETIDDIAKVKFKIVRKEFKKLFADNKIDLESYPKINKAFMFDDL